VKSAINTESLHNALDMLIDAFNGIDPSMQDVVAAMLVSNIKNPTNKQLQAAIEGFLTRPATTFTSDHRCT
jgi:hypothetical protein